MGGAEPPKGRGDHGWGSVDLSAASLVPTGVARLAPTLDDAPDEQRLHEDRRSPPGPLRGEGPRGERLGSDLRLHTRNVGGASTYTAETAGKRALRTPVGGSIVPSARRSAPSARRSAPSARRSAPSARRSAPSA